MDRIVEKSLLFDFYGELLTDHQRAVYSEYVQNDLSVTELAGLLEISRQGAHDMVRRCEKILMDYESRLHLLDHYMKVKKLVSQIQSYASEIKECDDIEVIRDKISDITRISDNIIDEY